MSIQFLEAIIKRFNNVLQYEILYFNIIIWDILLTANFWGPIQYVYYWVLTVNSFQLYNKSWKRFENLFSHIFFYLSLSKWWCLSNMFVKRGYFCQHWDLEGLSPPIFFILEWIFFLPQLNLVSNIENLK